MLSQQFTVGTTAVLVVAADDIPRTVYLHHDSNQTVWLGGSNVSSANGLHFPKEATMAVFVPQGQTIYAISDAAAQTVAVFSPDAD